MITGCTSISLGVLLKVLLPLGLAPAASGLACVEREKKIVVGAGRSALEAVGVGGLPAPAVLAHAGQVVAGGPAQLLARQRRIGVAGGDVAGTAGDDLVRDLAAAGGGEGVDQLQ